MRRLRTPSDELSFGTHHGSTNGATVVTNVNGGIPRAIGYAYFCKHLKHRR
jgi:hypothetical protein